MDPAIEDLRHVLAGEALSLDDIIDVPDVNLMRTGENYVPITKKTVTYIVCGVFFNEKCEVLMMQEAKESCYKKWYLPAGRMEPNETIEEAVIREVLEETGLKCKPTTLILVEVNQGMWYRFTMTGIITGGKLKTVSEGDKESLQACWYPVETVKNKSIPIRAKDIIKLIDVALVHRSSPIKHVDLRPAIRPQKKLLLRVVLVHCVPERNEVMLLINCKQRNHLPVKVISRSDVLLGIALNIICREAFGSAKYSPSLHGILSVEHDGRPAALNDGICLTILVSLEDATRPETVAKGSFAWLAVDNEDLKREICERCVGGRTVALLQI